MGRYTFGVAGPVLPWLGLGVGYEWGTFSLHQSLLGETDTDSTRAGFEFANLQAGADYHVAPRIALAPFFSFSIGQYQSVSTTTTNGMTTTTTTEDLAKTALHHWILIGLRVAFMP
jgi:hypothetical protein